MALALRRLVKARVYDRQGRVALQRLFEQILPGMYLGAALGNTSRFATNIYGPYVGRAVPWKGNPGNRPAVIVKVNNEFEKVAKQCAGRSGFVEIKNKKGEKVLVTKTVACIAENMRGKKFKE